MRIFPGKFRSAESQKYKLETQEFAPAHLYRSHTIFSFYF